MLIVKQATGLHQHLQSERSIGKKIGFVPTMGALHQGHLSLIRRSTTENDLTVCSIFVNPTQFNNPSDFLHYPKTVEQDIKLLLDAGVDVLFLPPVAEVYPGHHSKKNYNLGPVELPLEGAFRPGHFQGVAEVVDRLLRLTAPQVLYLGQKDFQQCMVVRRLLEITHQEHIDLRICETLREQDGLAMSSRNLRLSPADRQKAPLIYKCLQQVKVNLRSAPATTLEQIAKEELAEAGFQVDYVAIRRQTDLQPATGSNEPMVVLAAASLNGIRLIDNLLLN